MIRVKSHRRTIHGHSFRVKSYFRRGKRKSHHRGWQTDENYGSKQPWEVSYRKHRKHRKHRR